MNERERAEALARTIDEIIQGAQTTETSFVDKDLRSLIRVAEARRQASNEARQRAPDNESAVWQRLTNRLESHDQAQEDQDVGGHTDDDLRDIVTARRRVSEDVHKLAERHREEVWRRVQEKVIHQRPKRKRGIFSFLQSQTDGDLPLRRTGWGHTSMVMTGDADVDSLLRVALAHPTMHHAAHNYSEAQHQLRVRMRSDPAHKRGIQQEKARPGRSPGFWLRAAAASALAIAAIVFGPVPLTGLTGSPAIAAARSALEHLAVTETDVAPPPPGTGSMTSGVETTVADAASAIGLPLVAPAELMGFPITSQFLFTPAITGSESGTFVVTYSVTGASVVLYQEAAGGSDLAVPEGEAVDTLVNGLPATYYEGTWSQGDDGSLAWLPDGAQTFVFDRDGVRFTVVYTGPAVEPPAFAAAAGAIR